MKVGVTDTTLRDGQQSLIATRMPVGDMLPVLSEMDKRASIPWRYGAGLPSTPA